LGFKAVRIYPNYHNYDLTDNYAGQLAEAVAEAGLCLSVATRVEDFRQRHWLDTVEEVPFQKIVALVEKHPRGKYLVLDAYVTLPAQDPLWERLRALPIHFDLSRMTACLDDPLGQILSQLGEDRILLGTGFPFKTPSPAFLKMHMLNADERTKLAILHGNAARLFCKPNDVQ